MKHNEPSSATQALLVAVRVDVALRALPIGDQGPEICCAVSNVPRLLQLMTSLPLTGGALVNMAAACNFAAEARIPRPLARIIILIIGILRWRRPREPRVAETSPCKLTDKRTIGVFGRATPVASENLRPI